MKSLALFLFFITLLFNAQNNYKKIADNKIDSDRKTIAIHFINEYLAKCENKDYTDFQNYPISKRAELFLKNDLQKTCEKNAAIYGKIKL